MRPIYSAWKNNNVTPAAQSAQRVLNAAKYEAKHARG